MRSNVPSPTPMSSTSAPAASSAARYWRRGRAPRNESAPSFWKKSQIRDCSMSCPSVGSIENELVAAVAARLGLQRAKGETSRPAELEHLVRGCDLEGEPADPIDDVPPRRHPAA